MLLQLQNLLLQLIIFPLLFQQQLQQVREDALKLHEIAFDLDHAQLETISKRILETTDTLLKE